MSERNFYILWGGLTWASVLLYLVIIGRPSNLIETDVSTADTSGAMERPIHRHRNDNSDYTHYCLTRGNRVLVYVVDQDNEPINDELTIITLDKVVREPIGTNVPCK